MIIPRVGIEASLGSAAAPAALISAALPALAPPLPAPALEAAAVLSASPATEANLRVEPDAPPPPARGPPPIVVANLYDLPGIMAIENSSFLEIGRWPEESWAAELTDENISIKVIRE